MKQPSGHTTGRSRFVSAVSRLVGKTPPASAVDEWLAYPVTEPSNGSFELQSWVVNNLPEDMDWAQGIEILDAAQGVAQNPVVMSDGCHEPWPAREPLEDDEWVDFPGEASASEIAALQDAIEGECGFTVTARQAKDILGRLSMGEVGAYIPAARRAARMSLTAALGYADNPAQLYGVAPGYRLEGELTEALAVLASAYRAVAGAAHDPVPYAEFECSMQKTYGYCDIQCSEAFAAGMRYATPGQLPAVGYVRRIGLSPIEFVERLEYRSASDAASDPQGVLWQRVFTAGVASQEPQARDDGAWCALFRKLALELRCLPSSFIDGNEHVFKVARHAMSARANDEDRSDAACWRRWLPWMRRLKKKPSGLELEINRRDAERSAKDAPRSSKRTTSD